jgi:hypothetical protein
MLDQIIRIREPLIQARYPNGLQEISTVSFNAVCGPTAIRAVQI